MNTSEYEQLLKDRELLDEKIEKKQIELINEAKEHCFTTLEIADFEKRKCLEIKHSIYDKEAIFELTISFNLLKNEKDIFEFENSTELWCDFIHDKKALKIALTPNMGILNVSKPSDFDDIDITYNGNNGEEKTYLIRKNVANQTDLASFFEENDKIIKDLIKSEHNQLFTNSQLKKIFQDLDKINLNFFNFLNKEEKLDKNIANCSNEAMKSYTERVEEIQMAYLNYTLNKDLKVNQKTQRKHKL